LESYSKGVQRPHTLSSATSGLDPLHERIGGRRPATQLSGCCQVILMDRDSRRPPPVPCPNPLPNDGAACLDLLNCGRPRRDGVGLRSNTEVCRRRDLSPPGTKTGVVLLGSAPPCARQHAAAPSGAVGATSTTTARAIPLVPTPTGLREQPPGRRYHWTSRETISSQMHHADNRDRT
jgi:hypothetical protein